MKTKFTVTLTQEERQVLRDLLEAAKDDAQFVGQPTIEGKFTDPELDARWDMLDNLQTGLR